MDGDGGVRPCEEKAEVGSFLRLRTYTVYVAMTETRLVFFYFKSFISAFCLKRSSYSEAKVEQTHKLLHGLATSEGL